MPKRPASLEDILVARSDFPGHDWMARYIRYLEETQGLSVSSGRAYSAVWRAYLVFLAKRGLNACTATSKHAGAFLKLHQRSTALRYGRLLERVYTRAVSSRLATLNPFAELKALLAEQEERPPSVALALPSIEDLITRFPEPDDWQEQRDQAMVVLVASAGLRLQELRELEVTQFVPQSKGLEVQPRGRTAHSRVVLLDTEAADFITKWLNVRRELLFEAPIRYAFPSRRGEAIPVSTLYRRVRRLIERLYGSDALPRFGVGVLRATFAQRFRENDRVVQAQYALGHRRITSTLRYLHHIKPIEPKV